MEVLLFGDQTAGQFSLLRKLVGHKHNSVLSTFLERAAVALRDEIQRLPWSRRSCFPGFHSLGSLVEAYSESTTRIPELEAALVTIAQLGHYIVHCTKYPRTLDEISTSNPIGICTGLLAATAVSSARSLSELIPLAIETVKIAVRTGFQATLIAEQIEHSDDSSQSWATVVSNISESTAQAEIEAFASSNSIDVAHRTYVSAVGVNAVTISGPPSSRRRLFEHSAALKASNKADIPVYAPYHALHLFNDAVMDEILDEDTRAVLSWYKPVGKVLSSVTGEPLKTQDTIEAMRIALREIIQEPVRWDVLLQKAGAFPNPAGINYAVVSIGATNVASSLVSALKTDDSRQVAAIDYTTVDWDAAPQTPSKENDKIAIVGMAGRFPNAANHDELWKLLMQGVDAHKEIPMDRFDGQAHCDPSGKGKNKSHTPYGCFIDEPGLFDPRFFNMSPREAAQTDPMGRLALVTAYEALEMSGYVPNRTPSTKLERIGTFYGQTSDDWREINAAENIDTYFITGGIRAMSCGRINYYFKFGGPSYSVDTACSSSLAAIQLACTSLWAGDCDTACAGGLNVLTNPDIFAGLSKGHFLSKTGSCKTFDNAADGYCRGDGVGTVILKRYSDAIADKDNILGCILSAATNHSAQAVSITHPHAGAQESLYKKVLAQAGVDAHEVQYVEMHGTGTQAGDGIEMTSVTNVFAPRNRPRRDTPLYLGAVKANIGHGEAASGINSLAKVLMMMKKDCIPANVGIKGIMNTGFPSDLSDRNVHIPLEATTLPRVGSNRRRIFLNNFSAAGGNTAVLLEDGPLQRQPSRTDRRNHQPIVVSARAISSLRKNLKNMISWLEQNPEESLSSLSYTLTARRLQHNYRVAFAASDIVSMKSALQENIKDTYVPVSLVRTPVAFTFTGQGSQYTGLGKQMYETSPTFKLEIDRLHSIATAQQLPSFMPLLAGEDVQNLSPMVIQLGLSCIQVALARLWISWGVTPTVVIGHSLGEYAALHIAGVISATDMIRLVGVRAKLLMSNCIEFTHAMLAVKSSVAEIEVVLGSQMTEIACRNSAQETVLSGTMEAITEANALLVGQGTKTTFLKVPFAFHSAQVEPILDAFRSVTRSTAFKKPQVPVLSPLKAEVLRQQEDFDAEYLIRHARDTVDYSAALSAGLQDGIISPQTRWLEIGAHPVCAGFIKSTFGPSCIAHGSLRRNEDSWKTISQSICGLYSAGVDINFDEYHRDHNESQRLLTLPTYQFDNKRYWLDYHNNWCLTKGENLIPAEAALKSTAEPELKPQPRLSTTSCHRIIKETINPNSGSLVVRSDLTDPKLAVMVQGHMCNGSALCPSTLYADQALTTVDFLYKQMCPNGKRVGLNVGDMAVNKTLIAQVPPPPEGQFMEVETHLDMEAREARVKYRSVTPDGVLILDHANCIVKLEDPNVWQEQWSMTSYMVQTQIDLLKQKLSTGGAHSVLRGVAYKLFKSFVNYGEKYRGMEEVVINGKDTEATATVSFQANERDGDFFCSPYWIDSLCHITGFVVNGTDLIDSDVSVYVSHGWESMRFAKPFSADKKYTSYVRMLPKPNNVRSGTVYIFDGDEVVGVVGGVKFQQIPRRVLDTYLPPVRNKTGVKLQPYIAATMIQPVQREPKPKATTMPVLRPRLQRSKPSHSIQGPVARFMSILQAETDVNMSELVDDAAFDNLGVDSLLSLNMAARLREELELEIPASLFTDFTTVGAVKKYFSQYETADVDDCSSSADSESTIEPILDGETPFEYGSTSLSSPPSTISADEKPDFNFEVVAKPGSVLVLGDDSPSVARNIVAAEMGMPWDSIAATADLTELGMDSLMSLNILSSLREQTGIELPSEFLIANGTIEDIEHALGMRKQPQQVIKPAAVATTKALRSSKTPAVVISNEVIDDNFMLPPRDVSQYPKSASVLLQGNPKTCTQRLFLLPDGSGSATSYTSIPKIDPGVAVYALNCPFMKTPTDFTIGVEGVAAIYVNEIRRRQPSGPYVLGGWSAGGVIAYETACQLLAAGERVSRLVLIDAPCPVNLEPLPPRLHHFFDDIGLLGSGKGTSPPWLLPHFASSIRALDEYTPRPIPPRLLPSTFMIWAREGVCGKPGDPRPPPVAGGDPAPMRWLLENRTDFGDNGWGALVGTDKVEIGIMDGNHFTMMTGQNAVTLSTLIRKGMGL